MLVSAWRASFGMAAKLTMRLLNISREAVSIMAYCRPFIWLLVDSPFSAPVSAPVSEAATCDTRPVISSKSDLFRAGSMVDVCFTFSACSRSSLSSDTDVATAGTPGLSMSSAGILSEQSDVMWTRRSPVPSSGAGYAQRTRRWQGVRDLPAWGQSTRFGGIAMEDC